MFGEGVVNEGHFGGEATDDDGGFFVEEALFLEAVDHGEEFLGFTDGEDGDHDGATAFEGFVDVGQEAFFLSGPGITGVAWGGAAGGFENEGVRSFQVRETGSFGEGMICEVDVATVEEGFSAGFGEDSGRTHDVAGIEEGQLCFGAAGGVDEEGFFVIAGHPAGLDLIDFAVGVEGVFVNAEFEALAGHDVDGVMEEGFADGGGPGGHENGAGGVVPLKDGEGADVIEVRVADGDGVGAVIGQLGVARDGLRSFLFRVHSGIEDDEFVIEAEGVGISANFGAKIERLKGRTWHERQEREK